VNFSNCVDKHLKFPKKAREGDLLETHEGLIFDVKGIIQPQDRVIAFLRYYPDKDGNRERNGERYKKIYSLKARYHFLKNRFPKYLFIDPITKKTLQAVTWENVKQIYCPVDLVRKLFTREKRSENKLTSPLLKKAYELIKRIKRQAGIMLDTMGITGSLLVGLETESSDLDLIVYGMKNAARVREAMIQLFRANSNIQPYSKENIMKLYQFRGKKSNLTFEEFVNIEKRKKLQGLYKGTDFYIRCVKKWDEINLRYEEFNFQPLGRVIIRGEICNDLEAIMTPCRYSIDFTEILGGVKITERIKEIVSYRGRYCEVGQVGEKFEAYGELERVKLKSKEYIRLILGSNEDDYFKILSIS